MMLYQNPPNGNGNGTLFIILVIMNGIWLYKAMTSR